MASRGHGSCSASPSQASGRQQAAPPHGVGLQGLLLPEPQSDTSATRECTCLFFCMCAHTCGTHNYVCICACMHMRVQLSLGSCMAVCMAGRWLRVAHMCVVLVC